MGRAMNDQNDYEVDTLGYFPKPQPTDSEIAIIDDLLEKYGDALRTFVLMKREERKATLDARGSADLPIIPKFVCPILERNAGRFFEKFDKLLQVANE
jgi:hypothetical protein